MTVEIKILIFKNVFVSVDLVTWKIMDLQVRRYIMFA